MNRSTRPPGPSVPIWRRAVALGIDALLAWVGAAALLIVPFMAVVLVEEGGARSGYLSDLLIDGASATALLVLGGALLARNIGGRSPGLGAMSLCIVDARSARPGIKRGFVRSVVPSVVFVSVTAAGAQMGVSWPVTLLVSLAPYGVAIWDSERRTLHDLAAGTWVIEQKTAAAERARIEERTPGTM